MKFQILFLILAIVVFFSTALFTPAPVTANLNLKENTIENLVTSIGQYSHFLSVVECSSLLIGKVIANYKNHFTPTDEEPVNRVLIKEIIKLDPGITLREIKRETNLAMGVIQYHLNLLEGKEVESLKLGRTRHFFIKPSEFTEEGKIILSLQRNHTIKTIIELLNRECGFISQKELVKETGKSRALISYYIKSLKTYGIVETVPRQVKLNPCFTSFDDVKILV